MEIVTDPSAGRSVCLSHVFAIGFVFDARAAFGRTGAILAVLPTARAAMRRQRLAQSAARPVKPDTEGIARQSEIGRHGLSILLAEIYAPDQFGFRRAQFGNQPLMAGA